MHFQNSCSLEIQRALSYVPKLPGGARALNRISKAAALFALLAIQVWAQGSGGYLGVFLGDVNDERARELRLPEIRGAIVGKVEEGSPGEKAGLKENDVILSFNEHKIQNRTQFHRLLTASPAGSNVNLGISRGGKMQSLAVTVGERRQADADGRVGLFSEVNALLDLAEQNRQQAEELKLNGNENGATRLLEQEKAIRKEAEARRTFIEKELREGRIEQPAAVRRPDMAELTANLHRSQLRQPGQLGQLGQLGLTAIELTDQLARFFNVTGPGVLVTEVRAGEPAERAGIKAGDCVLAINGERIRLPADLTRSRMDKDQSELAELAELAVTIVRDRAEQVVKLKLAPR